MKRQLLTITLCLALPCAAEPTDTASVVTRYDEDSGLSQWYVTQVLQADDGMMWFSTWNGLDRFDGYSFENFKPQAGDGCPMATARIRDMRLDADGSILCRNDNGWFAFSPQTGLFAPVAAARHDSLLAAHDAHVGRYTAEREIVMDDRQGNHWRVTHNGVFRHTGNRGVVQPFGDDKRTVGCLFADTDGRCWLTTKDLHSPATGTVVIYTADGRLLGYVAADGRICPQSTPFGASVYCIFRTSAGDLWLGTKPDGLFRLRPLTADRFRIDNFRPECCRAVYDMAEDADGRLWIATLGSGLCVADSVLTDSPRFEELRAAPGYPLMREHRIRRLAFARSGALLAATTEGLLVMHHGRFVLHTRRA